MRLEEANNDSLLYYSKRADTEAEDEHPERHHTDVAVYVASEEEDLAKEDHACSKDASEGGSEAAGHHAANEGSPCTIQAECGDQETELGMRSTKLA